MKYWVLKLFNGFSNSSRLIRAINYTQAVQQARVSCCPPGYIWSIHEETN